MQCSSAADAFCCLINKLANEGAKSSPRALETIELLGSLVHFPMKRALMVVPYRRLSYQLMYREAWWVLTGQNRLDLLTDVAPQYARFSDDGYRLAGAYGPKIVDQIQYVVDTLAHDQDSRQAVITIWRESPRPSKDIPCTISTQFVIRQGYLHMFVNMRSNDIWLGFPYDVFTFTMLALQIVIELLARRVYVLLGCCYHYAGSRHIYLKDLSKTKPHPEIPEQPTICASTAVEHFTSPNQLHTALYESSQSLLPITTPLPWLNL